LADDGAAAAAAAEAEAAAVFDDDDDDQRSVGWEHEKTARKTNGVKDAKNVTKGMATLRWSSLIWFKTVLFIHFKSSFFKLKILSQ